MAIAILIGIITIIIVRYITDIIMVRTMLGDSLLIMHMPAKDRRPIPKQDVALRPVRPCTTITLRHRLVRAVVAVRYRRVVHHLDRALLRYVLLTAVQRAATDNRR